MIGKCLDQTWLVLCCFQSAMNENSYIYVYINAYNVHIYIYTYTYYIYIYTYYIYIYILYIYILYIYIYILYIYIHTIYIYIYTNLNLKSAGCLSLAMLSRSGRVHGQTAPPVGRVLQRRFAAVCGGHQPWDLCLLSGADGDGGDGSIGGFKMGQFKAMVIVYIYIYIQ